MEYNLHKTLILRSPLLRFRNIVTVNELKDIYYKKHIKEALFLASPDLNNQYKRWIDNKIENKNEIDRLIVSLSKYFTRMNSRCTPFGLFAGCTVAQWGDKNDLVLLNYGKNKRHTRLDMHYLGALAQELAKQPFIKPHLLFFPNSSAYFFGDKIRYVEYKYKDKKRVHHISSVDNSSYLKRILNQATNGSKLSNLASLLVDDGISVTEADEFLEDVVQAQLLVSELEPAITGNELMQQILDALNEIQTKYPTQDLRKIIDILGRVNCDLNTIDGKIGNDVKKYHEIIENLKILDIPFEQNKLFQTDMLKLSKKMTLDKGIQKDLFEILKVLNLINGKSKKTNLNKFKEAFYEKYETREVPLLEALDNETGLGYPVDITHSGDFNPLVDDIKLPFKNGDREVQWGKWESFLNREMMHACIENKFIVKLDERKISKIFNFDKTRWNDLPDTMAIMFSCLGKIDGRYMIYLRSTGGSSATNLLGRFAHTDQQIYNLVSSIAEREQELNPTVIIAEIVHLPENRTGNILQRPVF